MESDSHANEKNHGVVDLLFECDPNECENYGSKNDTACPLNIAPRCDPFVSKDHRNSDLNVDSTRVTAISKQMSLPPFIFLETIRHIRHFFIDKVFKETL